MQAAADGGQGRHEPARRFVRRRDDAHVLGAQCGELRSHGVRERAQKRQVGRDVVGGRVAADVNAKEAALPQLNRLVQVRVHDARDAPVGLRGVFGVQGVHDGRPRAVGRGGAADDGVHGAGRVRFCRTGGVTHCGSLGHHDAARYTKT